jgi:hypothetical protein
MEPATIIGAGVLIWKFGRWVYRLCTSCESASLTSQAPAASLQEAPVLPVSNPPATIGAKILNAAEQARDFVVEAVIRPVETFVDSVQERVQGAAEAFSGSLKRIRKTIVARTMELRFSAVAEVLAFAPDGLIKAILKAPPRTRAPSFAV